MENNNNKKELNHGKMIGLLPLLVFLFVYLFSSIITKDFYKMPVTVAFVAALIVALVMNKERTLDEKLETFSRGAGDPNILLMILIFIFAGAFAQTAKDMGAVDSTVNLGLAILPAKTMVVGIFVMACFISTSIGTSIGTLVALTPVAVAIGENLGLPVGLVVAAVVGGSMFGDNLSMISDTTIAATRTQGCEMKDKFRCNFKIAIIAGVISAVIFFLMSGSGQTALDGEYTYNLIKIVPYIFVLVTALLGVNVITVLLSGTAIAGVIGMATGAFDFWGFVSSMSTGMIGMSEITIITILVAGIVEIIKVNGGIDYVIFAIRSRIKSERGAMLGVAALVGIIDACTANNTVSIVMAGPIAKEVGEEYSVEPKKLASILDIFSCVVQGIIPYGAQLLMAGGIAGISSFAIMKYLFYPYLLGIVAIIAIVIKKL